MQLRGWVSPSRSRELRLFSSPGAAQLWLEWRRAGYLLPVLVGALLIGVVCPLSWLVRTSADRFLPLLASALALPIVLAAPVETAFSKPDLWKADLGVPSFMAVSPLCSNEMVIVRLKTAALSALISWGLVLAFLATWLPTWANTKELRRLGQVLWQNAHHHSLFPQFAMAVLLILGGIFLTWRFLVAGLWLGLSGSQNLFTVSALSLVIVPSLGLWAFDEWVRWILDDPSRLTPFVWIAAACASTRFWLAAYSWHGADPRFVRRYLMIWIFGAIAMVTLALMTWDVLRLIVGLDSYQVLTLLVLAALLVMPLAQLGLAPLMLSRNRHRS